MGSERRSSLPPDRARRRIPVRLPVQELVRGRGWLRGVERDREDGSREPGRTVRGQACRAGARAGRTARRAERGSEASRSREGHRLGPSRTGGQAWSLKRPTANRRMNRKAARWARRQSAKPARSSMRGASGARPEVRNRLHYTEPMRTPPVRSRTRIATLGIVAGMMLGAAGGTSAATPPGPEEGEEAPSFEAIDHEGNARDFESLTGEDGLLLLFFRSADW